MSIDPLTSLAGLVQAYGEAWNGHDIDAIMSMHTEDTMFRRHVGADPGAFGHDAVREAFAAVFKTMPDIHFESRRLLMDDAQGFFVHEMTYTATIKSPPGTPGEIDSSRSVNMDIVDVITVRDGLVVTKDTYVDPGALEQQTARQ